MKKYYIIITLISGLAMWQCSRTDSELSLKQSIENGVAKINVALSKISETKGYQLMTVTDDATKSDEEFNDSITLDLVAGIYEFQPQTFICHHSKQPFWLYKKTGESDMMIVNLPQRMVFHPKFMYYMNLPDTAAKNDFSIIASDYHFYYSWWNHYDYKLKAGFLLDSKDIGTLDVLAAGDSFSDRSYSSEFTFTDDYSVKVLHESGDTSTSSFALMKGDETLLGETAVFIRKESHKREKQYTLSIGKVDIVRTTGIDSIQVFLDGVLQKTAAAKITDTDESGSICHHRDLLLTYDDGTTAKLSELIEPAMTTLKTLVGSMHSMYFAQHVVDHIALSIYYYRIN